MKNRTIEVSWPAIKESGELRTMLLKTRQGNYPKHLIWEFLVEEIVLPVKIISCRHGVKTPVSHSLTHSHTHFLCVFLSIVMMGNLMVDWYTGSLKEIGY